MASMFGIEFGQSSALNKQIFKERFVGSNRTTEQNNMLDQSIAHHLGISYYVNFLGRLGSNGFQLKRWFGTHGN